MVKARQLNHGINATMRTGKDTDDREGPEVRALLLVPVPLADHSGGKI